MSPPKAEPVARDTIAIRFHALDELFDGMDPAPVTERDLDADAEEFIVSWARELASEKRLVLVIHLPEEQRTRQPEAIVGPAVHRHFSYKSDLARLDLKRRLREARLALMIGVLFLVACMGLRELIRALAALPHGSLARILEEGLHHPSDVVTSPTRTWGLPRRAPLRPVTWASGEGPRPSKCERVVS